MPDPPPTCRLDEFVFAGLTMRGDAIAVSARDGEFTGLELVDRVIRLAAVLQTLGIAIGDAVLVAVDNGAADIVCQLAVWKVGAVAIPVHRATPVAVVTDVAQRSGARAIVGEMPAGWDELVSGSEADLVHRLDLAGDERPAELDSDQALVIFTSGSTGRPKGVVISHRAFTTKLAVNAAVLRFAPGETTLQVLQLHFSFGQWTTLLTLATGGRLDLVQRYDTDSVLAALSSGPGYDRVPVVPTMMRMIDSRLTEADSGGVLERMRSARSPRTWIAGGEPLPAGLGLRFRHVLPDSGIADVFGLSETATSDFIVTPDRYDQHAGSIGLPAPGVTARLVADPDGARVEVANGEVGELWLRTPHLMTGYLADPAQTATALAGEWLRTGDLARLRADGTFELAGRAKSLIVRGGVKVSPLEIENVYTAHPDCSGALAVGVLDDILGERIHLLVTERAGHNVDSDEVRNWGRSRLEPSKVPDAVSVVAEFPLGVTGKTDRIAAQRDLVQVLTESP